MIQPFQVYFPGAQLEIKIVLPIPFRRCLLSGTFHRVYIRLRQSLKGLQADNEAAQHKKSMNVFDVHRYPLLIRLAFLLWRYAEKLTRTVVYHNSHFAVLRYATLYTAI